ncbi:MAG: DUF3524 domain-containing protein [Acidobacteriota bacterium]
MKVLLISPYHGGSHQAWAEGYRKHSAHDLELLTLPSRYWKWRMHGGAVTLARRFLDSLSETPFECILATSMLDLTTFLALTRSHTARIPAALYMHENQLTYPLPEDGATGPMRRQLGERDQHYAFINYSSALAAGRVFFNSRYHQESFFEALGPFLKHFPEYRELESIEWLRRKSSLLPVGIELPARIRSRDEAPPLVLWNQRWEYDKNPGEFFQALKRARQAGLEFRLALCGERFSRRPEAFEEGIGSLREHVVQQGFVDRKAYRRLLHQASVVISTAHHEFFGVSILEAAGHGAFPILPARLSYPELVPSDFHSDCLYNSPQGLDRRLWWALSQPVEAASRARQLAARLKRFQWRRVAPRYDEALDALAGAAGRLPS